MAVSLATNETKVGSDGYNSSAKTHYFHTRSGSKKQTYIELRLYEIGRTNPNMKTLAVPEPKRLHIQLIICLTKRDDAMGFTDMGYGGADRKHQ